MKGYSVQVNPQISLAFLAENTDDCMVICWPGESGSLRVTCVK